MAVLCASSADGMQKTRQSSPPMDICGSRPWMHTQSEPKLSSCSLSAIDESSEAYATSSPLSLAPLREVPLLRALCSVASQR